MSQKLFLCDYFCDKWFLYPKLYRKYFIQENKLRMKNKEDVLIITSLDCYEDSYKENEDKDVLSNFIYFGTISSSHYIQFTCIFLDKMEVYRLGNFLLSKELNNAVNKYRFNKVIDEIKNEVAYRPFKVGYEEAKERFERSYTIPF